MTNARLAFLFFAAAAALCPANAHTLFGLPHRGGLAVLHDLVAHYSAAHEKALCGDLTRIVPEKGIVCVGNDERDIVVVPADALRDAGFKFGAHEGKPHLSYHGELNLSGPITQEQAAAIIDGVEREQERERQRKAVEQYMPMQGNYTIEDLFNAAPR